jgi:hypothetical protein
LRKIEQTFWHKKIRHIANENGNLPEPRAGAIEGYSTVRENLYRRKQLGRLSKAIAFCLQVKLNARFAVRIERRTSLSFHDWVWGQREREHTEQRQEGEAEQDVPERRGDALRV